MMAGEIERGNDGLSVTERSVPDIATLRAICHKGKLERDRRWWYAGWRRISIYITWLLIHTTITANQVTATTVFLALAGSLLLASAPAGVAFAGAFTLIVYHLLDKVDGDLARFRNAHSLVGVYLDEVGHGVAFAGVFLGLGSHLAWNAGSSQQTMLCLGAGGVGAVALVLARLHKSAPFLLYAQYVLVQPALLPRHPASGTPHPLSREAVHRSRRGEGVAAAGVGRLVARARDAVLLLGDFSLILLLTLGGLALEMATGSRLALQGLLFAEAGLQVLVCVALVVINVSANVEAESLRLDALAKGGEARPTSPAHVHRADQGSER